MMVSMMVMMVLTMCYQLLVDSTQVFIFGKFPFKNLFTTENYPKWRDTLNFFSWNGTYDNDLTMVILCRRIKNSICIVLLYNIVTFSNQEWCSSLQKWWNCLLLYVQVLSTFELQMIIRWWCWIWTVAPAPATATATTTAATAAATTATATTATTATTTTTTTITKPAIEVVDDKVL